MILLENKPALKAHHHQIRLFSSTRKYDVYFLKLKGGFN